MFTKLIHQQRFSIVHVDSSVLFMFAGRAYWVAPALTFHRVEDHGFLRGFSPQRGLQVEHSSSHALLSSRQGWRGRQG
jgi:hypothetical protein